MEREKGNFFEVILTRPDDHEFVGVARFGSPEGVSTVVESGERIVDLWRKLVEDKPDPRKMM